MEIAFMCFLKYFSGNALYEKTITNKEKHTKITHCTDIDTEPMKFHNERILHNLSIEICFWVYSLMKMRMLPILLRLYKYFFNREKFEFLRMDTNS